MTSCLARDRVYVMLLAKTNDFLSGRMSMKTVEKRRRAIEKNTAGVDIPEFFRNGSDEPG